MSATDKSGTPPKGQGGFVRPTVFRGADPKEMWPDTPGIVPGAEAARSAVAPPESVMTGEMPSMEKRSDAPVGPPTTSSGLIITPICRTAPTDDSVKSIGRGGKRCGQGRMDPG